MFNQQPKTAAHEMYEKFVDKLKLQTKRSVDGDYFRREGASRGVHIDLKSDLKKGQIKPIANTWFHEFAHHIDYTSKRGRNKYYSISYRNGSFEKALRQDYANLLKKFGSDIDISIELNSYFPEENFDVSDIIEGITNGRIKGSFGHISQDPHYWTREGGSALPKEAFAEFTSAYITCPSSLYMLKQWFPNADKVYNEIVKEILSKV